MALLFLSFPLFINFSSDSIPYNLNRPAQVINLSESGLNEISGLTATDNPDLLCAIGDERGELFFINIANNGTIDKKVLFREKGDFEGLEFAEGKIYAVKSDGKVFEINDLETASPTFIEYQTPLDKSADIEGLCYDARRHALLLAAKGEPKAPHKRCIHVFDLKTKSLLPDPAYEIDVEDINKRLAYDESDKPNFLSPSSVAVSPDGNSVYVLSSALKRLVVLNYTDGRIIDIIRINPAILPQPEGLTFDSLNRLWISSEARKGEASKLVRFDLNR